MGTRTATIYAPDNRDKPALVISMHGIGGGAWWSLGAMDYKPYADTGNLVVAYPNGENSQWDLGGDKDVNFVLAIIDSMSNRYQIDRDRVYASGFSMGGMMSWYLACKIPDKIAAIVGGDGYPLGGLSGCSEVRHVPALQIHGTADDFVSYSGFVGSFLPSQRTRYGCPANPETTKPYPVEVNGRNAKQLAQPSKSFLEYWGPCEKNGLTSELALLSVDGMIHDWATADKANGSDDPNYKGKSYDVTFDAYSTGARTIEANVEQDTDPWTSYLPGVRSFDLSTTKKKCSFFFTMESPTDSNGRISINVGITTETVFLDNISIQSTTVGVRPRVALLQGRSEWSDGVLRLSGLESGRLRIVDMRGHSWTVEVAGGRALTGPLPAGVYQVHVVGAGVEGFGRFAVLPPVR